MEEVSLSLTGIAWNEGSRFLPEYNGLGMKEVWFWPHWNSLEWWKWILVQLKWLKKGFFPLGWAGGT
jgi:hypothetical protein